MVIGQSLHHESLDLRGRRGLSAGGAGARGLPGQRYATVGSDNETGGHDACAHLLAQGCRRIAFLGDPAAPEVAARRERLPARAARGRHRARCAAGDRRALRQRHGLPRGGGLLDAGVEFDGIVACSDVFAINAMRALAERDRKVPADVAITGFDDIPFAALTTPPLTTIRRDYQSRRATAGGEPAAQVRGEAAGTMVIPATLVVRASSLREQYRALPSIRGARRGEAGSRGGPDEESARRLNAVRRARALSACPSHVSGRTRTPRAWLPMMMVPWSRPAFSTYSCFTFSASSCSLKVLHRGEPVNPCHPRPAAAAPS